MKKIKPHLFKPQWCGLCGLKFLIKAGASVFSLPFQWKTVDFQIRLSSKITVQRLTHICCGFLMSGLFLSFRVTYYQLHMLEEVSSMI
jgi:hypothetical protein